jgi:cephalosporin hydroxylase
LRADRDSWRFDVKSRRYRLRKAAVDAVVKVYLRSLSRPVARLGHLDLILRTGTFGSVSWLGMPIWQSILDLWTTQETISEVRPALLIETGTHRGGSALFYAQLMELLGIGRIITIDIVNKHQDVRHPRITFLDGSSTDPKIVEQVRGAAAEADGPIMVILDGEHARDHVAQELELYGPLVTPGSFLLSQDGSIDEFWLYKDSRPGPLAANRNFLERHPEFEYDRDRNERYGHSHHPLGWMRRRY